MKRILKIFLTLVLAVSMMLEMVPVNRVYAEGEAVEETTTEPAAQETDQGSTEGTDEQDTTDVQTEGTDELPVVEEEQTEEEAEVPAEAPVVEDNAGEEETVELNETAPETDSEEDVVLNAESFELEKELDNGLKVTVAFKAGTVPEGTEVVVAPAKEEALEAAKAARGEDYEAMGADISFVYNGKEIEPNDYSENKVNVTLSFEGEEELGSDFETSHLKESLDEEGNVVYTPEKVEALMTDITKEVEVEYEETWTETVTKYKEVDVYGDVEVEYEEEVPVYETREITEERTEYVTKTREVEKTRYVKVKVAFKWYDPTTWLGYKIVEEKYTVTEEYQEPVIVTVVVGTEQVQVGTEKVKKTRTERGVVGTEKVEDGTEEITHTETKTRTETIVVGQIASFEADDFSTFTVTWGNNTRVTIHHGYMENGSFVEFPAGSSTNTNYPGSLNGNNYSNGDYAVLIYDFKDYTYNATYYRTSTSSTPASGGTAIWPALHRRNGWGSNDWTYNNASRTSWNSGWGSDGDGSVANNSHIYVIYTPKTITEGYTPSSDGDDPGTPTPSAFTPDVGKNVTDQKEDGTYDITLGFVGNKESTESKTTARVIVVFDLSGSMEEDIAGNDPYIYDNWGNPYDDNPDFDGTSRLTLAKNAVNALANTLLALEDSQGNKLVEMGLVTFATDGRIRSFGTGTNASNFTSNYTTYSGVISNLSVSGNDDLGTGINDIGRGTNWEKGLDLANSMAASTAGKTYIVFVSDGDPTYRISRGSYSDSVIINEINQNGYSNRLVRVKTPIFGYGSGADTITRCYATSREVAKSIVDHNKTLYVVGLSNDATNMTNLATYSGGTYKAGNDADEFAKSLADIAGSISSEIGLTDMTITDGVTSMSQIETQSLIGTAGNFTYNKSYPLAAGGSGYTYTIGTTTYNITQAQVDAGSDGTHKIFSRQVNGVTVYYVEYPWDDIPEGAEAEINSSNAVVWNTSDANDQLEHGVYYSVTFTVWPKQEAYDLIADLDNDIVKVTDADLAAGTKAQLRVLVNGRTYEYDTASGTWTNGLTDAQLQALIDANDASFSMKTNTGLSATYKYGGVDSSATYTNYTNGNMSLDDTSIMIKKTWNNYMDARYATDVTLTITRNGEDYTTFRMGTPVEVTTEDGKQWVQEPEDNLYISLGVLSVTGENIVVREAGYDYTVVEPQEFDYRWDLTADIYHPMVINGRTTVLVEIQDENAEDVPEAAKNLTENKTVTVDGAAYYNFNDHLYVAKTGENLLEATNDRRSNLIISKVVDENDALKDDLFPIQITIDDPNGHYPDDDDYSDYYDTIWFYISTASNDATTIVTEDVVIDGATAEERDGTPTGYYWFDNGGTATVSVKAGWFINIINLRKDANYTIVEPTATIPDGYTFEKASFDYSNYTGEVPTAPEIKDNTVKGSIDISNTEFKVKYDNKFEGFYYVYHSGNNEVYRYPIAVNGEKVESFDIYEMTLDGTLYGGYYKDYSGKSENYDSADLTYTNEKSLDEEGEAYSYAYIESTHKGAWNGTDAYDEIGTAVTPVRNTTYFLKEVPENYLLPYTHYTYYKDDKRLADLYHITALDDLNYEKAGFIIQTDDKPATVVDSLTIKAKNSTATTTLTAAKVYKAKEILDGYLGYATITDYKGSDITIKQYWTTPDGIVVKGTKMRKLHFANDKITGLTKEDVECD